jgi:hypothetical protein
MGLSARARRAVECRRASNKRAKDILIIYSVDTAAFFRETPVITLDSYNEAMKRNPDGW